MIPFRYQFVYLLAIVNSMNKVQSYNETNKESYIGIEREPRINPLIIPFWRIYVVPRTPCTNALNQQGVCMARGRCDANNGAPSGSCAQRRGVCCVFQRTCGQSSSARVTYFTNTEYPSPNKGGTRCTLQINKANSNICQLRIDFLEFTLSQPSSEGNCDNDFFTVSDSTNPAIPTICGSNSGQHIYVDFNSQCDFLQLVVDTNANIAYDRRWNMMITQVPCNSTYRAPKGCLMYYNTTSGSVSSFNYGTIVTGTENLQLNNLNYGICIEPISDYCSIEWMMADTNSFSLSSETIGVGEVCTHNFIVIPNPYQDGIPVGADRFCGNSFATTTSSSEPYVLTVVTTYEPGDEGNRGFQLNYRQVPCRP